MSSEEVTNRLHYLIKERRHSATSVNIAGDKSRSLIKPNAHQLELSPLRLRLAWRAKVIERFRGNGVDPGSLLTKLKASPAGKLLKRKNARLIVFGLDDNAPPACQLTLNRNLRKALDYVDLRLS